MEVQLEIGRAVTHQVEMVMLATRPRDLLGGIVEVVPGGGERAHRSIHVALGDQEIDVAQGALERDGGNAQHAVDLAKHRQMSRVVHLAREGERVEPRREVGRQGDATLLPRVPEDARHAMELGAREHLARACSISLRHLARDSWQSA